MAEPEPSKRIFVDSNIPMYVIGEVHPNKVAAQRLISEAALARHSLVTDAEVLQEIMHRYASIRRRDAIDPAFALLLGISDEVLPVERIDAERARRLLVTTGSISARDAIHVAIMQRHGINEIMSFDRGFDHIAGLRRVS